MNWRLRRAADSDAAAVAMVAAASFLDAFYDDLSGDDIVAHNAKHNTPEKFAGWIADPASVVTLAAHPITGCPIGYTVLTVPDLPVATEPDDIELKRIYTLPGAGGTGLGAMLMAAALEDARGLHKKRVLLGVYSGNARAQLFYERQGFAVIGTRSFLVGSTWHDDLIFARNLD